MMHIEIKKKEKQIISITYIGEIREYNSFMFLLILLDTNAQHQYNKDRQ